MPPIGRLFEAIGRPADYRTEAMPPIGRLFEAIGRPADYRL